MTKTIQGNFQYPDGSPAANAILNLKLSQDAVVLATSQIAPRVVSITLNGSGAIPAATVIYANDELSPSGTVYETSVIAVGGGLIYGPELFSLTGASPINLNSLVPVLSGGIVLFYANPILSNPAAAQTITGFGLTLTNTAPLTVQGILNVSSVKTFDNVQWVDSSLSRGGIDIGDEINKAYAAGPSTGVHIHVAPGTYTYVTPIIFATGAKPIFLECAPGVGTGNPSSSATTFLNYTPTIGTAMTFNTGQGSRMTGCAVVGSGIGNSTIGVLVGGSNGFQLSHLQQFDISGFGVGLQFGNNVYISSFDYFYIHDNGVNGTTNIYVPSGTTGVAENNTFSSGAVANKPSSFSTTCVNLAGSVGDWKFKDVSFDQCGFTINAVNCFIDFVNVHMENPNGATASPFFTFGTACNFCSLTNSGGWWLEDGTTGVRTEFIKDASTVVNHDVEVNILSGVFVPNETVTQLVNLNTGSACCGRATLTGFVNGFGASQFTTFLGGVPEGFASTIQGLDCGTTSTCAANTLIGPAGGNKNLKVVKGSAPLVSGTPSTVTITGILPAFTSTSSYVCTVTNATNAANSALKVVNVSLSSFTITGPNTITDTINYICVGI